MKTRNKLILVAALVAVAFTCWLGIRALNESLRYKLPPPGWTIVTDGEGHWGARFPGSRYVIEHKYNGTTINSKREAIDKAWMQYNFQYKEILDMARNPRHESPNRQWREP